MIITSVVYKELKYLYMYSKYIEYLDTIIQAYFIIDLNHHMWIFFFYDLIWTSICSFLLF